MSSHLREFMLEWNQRYPIDKWWREKYNVPFGSKRHRAQSMIDMRLEFEEDLIFAEAEAEQLNKLRAKSKYVPGEGVWLKRIKRRPSQADIERDFDNLDIDRIAQAKVEIVGGKKRITF